MDAMISGIVMNGPTPTMLLMLSAVACSRPKPRCRPYFSLIWSCPLFFTLRSLTACMAPPKLPAYLTHSRRCLWVCSYSGVASRSRYFWKLTSRVAFGPLTVPSSRLLT